MHKRIVDAMESLNFATKCFDETVEQVQSECEHTDIVQCPQKTYHYANPQPPIRLCLQCGLAEEVWYEYLVTVLKNPTPEFGLREISRDRLHNMRVGKVITYNED